MTNTLKRVFFLKFLIAGVLLFTLNAWALHPSESAITNPNRGPVALDDDCGDCLIDYTGLRFLGSGGQGGRGVIHWPGDSTGVNYGQMCFTSDCMNEGALPNPVYAWCTDVYHPVETANYGVDVVPAVITADMCRETQLTAMAYLLAWNIPATVFEDDAMQVAMWKLSSIRDGGPNDGLPHFCYDAGIGYPNFGDIPVYPYLNTVYCSNAPRNDWANAKVYDAIGKNVLMLGDVIADECIGPVVDGDYATTTLKFCVTRGGFAQSVNNTGVEKIALNMEYQIGDGPLTSLDLLTDEFGCVSLTITQLIDEAQPVFVTICTNSAWPMNLLGCDEEHYSTNQWLVLSAEPNRLCFEWEFPADKWLSVELASFDAFSTANGVDLQWRTASESNADHWEVLRSVAGGNSFTQIAQLNAHNSATGATYTFADRSGTNGALYDYRLVDVDASGARTEHPNTVTAMFGQAGPTVLEYSLEDAYPNPFNPNTTISFTIPDAEAVALRVHDISGREVATLVNGTLAAGQHTVEWNAAGLPSGTYFYSLKTATFTSTKKVLLLK
ncbi:MAG: T9SS type A sorting domain-containing protein [Calditrichaeota bacterium]|nr:T9SS type A sorting domain-containing protein [Calditrichota bacterium]